MASGDTLFVFTATDFNANPTTNYATFDTFAATTGIRPVLDFIGSGGSADETAIALCAIPAHYDGGGVNVVVWYSPDGTQADPVQWQVAFEGLSDGDETDTGTGNPDFGTATNITDTPSAVAYTIAKTSAGAISHANMGSPAVGDAMRFKINRNYDHDTGASDDCQLHRVVITEQ